MVELNIAYGFLQLMSQQPSLFIKHCPFSHCVGTPWQSLLHLCILLLLHFVFTYSFLRLLHFGALPVEAWMTKEPEWPAWAGVTLIVASLILADGLNTNSVLCLPHFESEPFKQSAHRVS